MKKIAINLVLLVVSGFVGYYLYKSIERPIAFKNEWDRRESVVRETLKEIADLQKMYKDLNGSYANNFDSLAFSLSNDTFFVEKVFGDAGDSTQTVERKVVAIPARDSLMSFLKKKEKNVSDLNAYFQSIRTIPFSKDNKNFVLKADSARTEAADGNVTSLPTFEVSAVYADYMHEFDSSYMIYQPTYDPAALRKVGDLSKPSTNGNW